MDALLMRPFLLTNV